ncbi:sensor histidine kinase [Reichenbachiella ulvae]|uniref:sensor histidine kinase n=1 Tax=Reichenbachiella ulvae TaxID=2980104 RepID=UPI0029906CA9|nr:HAMP domain-containing sensor histidine kinase [Reichenbachiella ulvae]
MEKKAQNLLVQQIDELKKVNFELDRFVYSVSHDLRAPLLSIKGLVNISITEKPSPPLMKYLELITTSVDRLDKFIMDILDYSRNSRLEIQYQLIHFDTIIQETINNLSHIGGYQRLKFKNKIELNHPFKTDKRRISMILSNLISNAIKYQDYDKASEIMIEISESAAGLRIEVADNGIGIEPDQQCKIFDMFYRASDRSKGAGLGLYIIKEAVEKMNGSIELNSMLGKFTRFTITLPFIKTNNHLHKKIEA